MRKILIFTAILFFSAALPAPAQEGVIMLNSPEEIEEFKKLLENKTLITENAVEESSSTVSVELSPSEVLPVLPADTPQAESGVIILESEEEIKALNEKISALADKTYGASAPETQQR